MPDEEQCMLCMHNRATSATRDAADTASGFKKIRILSIERSLAARDGRPLLILLPDRVKKSLGMASEDSRWGASFGGLLSAFNL